MPAGITTIREIRVGLSRTQVNPLKWLTMALAGFLTLSSIAVVHIESPSAALTSIVVFGLAAAPTAAIVPIHGNPFLPPSEVKPRLIREALDRADCRTGPFNGAFLWPRPALSSRDGAPDPDRIPDLPQP